MTLQYPARPCGPFCGARQGAITPVFLHGRSQNPAAPGHRQLGSVEMRGISGVQGNKAKVCRLTRVNTHF